MPTEEQREAIWQIHLKKCGLPLDAERPKAEMWTGADIAQCCRLSVLMQESLLDAARRVVPNYVRYRDRLESVCRWADRTTLDAETGFPYVFDDQVTKANASLFDASRSALAAQPTRSRKITRKTVGSNNG